MPVALQPRNAEPGAIIKQLAIGLSCVGLLLVLGWSRGAAASYWTSIPEADFKFLPEYCKLAVRRYGDQHQTLRGATAEELAPLTAFEKRMGCAGDLHHYCAGLWHLHTTALPNPWLPRDHLLGEAVGEFQYTLRGCEAANAPMKPEILTNQGRAYIELKDYQSATKVLTEAIRRNPKYVNAYVELSGVFLRLNNTEDARKILEDGLKKSPDSKLLKARLKRLDAKEGPAQEQEAPAPGTSPAPR